VARLIDWSRYNGVQLGGVGKLSKECTVLLGELDLSNTEAARGQTLYMFVQVNVTLPKTGVALVMDDGTGGWKVSADSDCGVGWNTLTYQLTMGQNGTARFGLQVFSSDAGSETAQTVVEVAAVVVSPVGDDWRRL